jgi:hypothetical protein
LRVIALTNLLGLSWLTTLGIPQAQATPVANSAGDYLEYTGTERQRAQAGPEKWEVTDPTGLNCRIADTFYGVALDGSNQTLETVFRDNYHDVGQWPILTTLTFKQLVPAIRGRLMGLRQRQVLDRQGKPWFAVRSAKGDCFLRANRQYVMPVDSASAPSTAPSNVSSTASSTTPSTRPSSSPAKASSLLKPGQYYAQGSMFSRSGRQVYVQGDRLCLRLVDGPPSPYQGDQKITISSFEPRQGKLYSSTTQMTLDVSQGNTGFRQNDIRALWELAPGAPPLSLPAPEQQALNRCLASNRPFSQVLKGAFIQGLPLP